MAVYLDHNASSPMPPHVLDALVAALQDQPGNPSSRHQSGKRARALLEDARTAIARRLGARPSEIVFTSGGTESNNLALKALLRARAPRRRIVVAATEHPSVLELAQALVRDGYERVVVPVDTTGVVDPDRFRRELGPETALAAVMLANNESGVLQDVAALARICGAAGVPLHCDAVQAVGKIPVSLPALGASTVAFTAHKLGGPIGIGALWVERDLAIAGEQVGGGQERGLRAGTPPFALAHAFAAALDVALLGLDAEAARQAALRDRLETSLVKLAEDAIILGRDAPRLPNTCFVAFPGCDGGELAAELDLRGIRVATGSACGAHDRAPSHVATAMGLTPAQAHGTLRLSLGRDTSSAGVESAIEAIRQAISE